MFDKVKMCRGEQKTLLKDVVVDDDDDDDENDYVMIIGWWTKEKDCTVFYTIWKDDKKNPVSVFLWYMSVVVIEEQINIYIQLPSDTVEENLSNKYYINIILFNQVLCFSYNQ